MINPYYRVIFIVDTEITPEDLEIISEITYQMLIDNIIYNGDDPVEYVFQLLQILEVTDNEYYESGSSTKYIQRAYHQSVL